MIKTLKKICVVLGFLATSLSMAQSNTIKMLVAFPPGGPVDFVARTIAEPLGKELGAQILIDNKPGGNGAIAAEMAKYFGLRVQGRLLLIQGYMKSYPITR